MDSIFNDPEVVRAYEYAAAAHEAVGQRRKFTGEPYITHPLAVARILAGYQASSALLQAAMLHDVLEDTRVTFVDLVKGFGQDVAQLVLQVSQVSKLEDGPRAKRMQMDLEHYARGTADAQTLKVADSLHNSISAYLTDRNFAPKYLREKLRLIEALTLADPQLRGRALRIVTKLLARLRAQSN